MKVPNISIYVSLQQPLANDGEKKPTSLFFFVLLGSLFGSFMK